MYKYTFPYLSKLKSALIYLLIFLLPTQLGKHYFFDFSYISGVRIDYLAPTIFVTDILVFLLVILNLKKIGSYLKTQNTWLITIIFLSNIFFAISLPIGLYKTLKYLEIFFLFVVIHKEKLNHRTILQAFLIGSIVELALAIFQFIHKTSLQGLAYLLGERNLNLSMPDIAKASLQGVEILRPYGTFSHPNSMGGFYLLVYFFTVSNKQFDKHPWLKNSLIFVSSLLVFFSFSKIAIGVFVALNAILLLRKWKEIDCGICIFARIGILATMTLIFASSVGDPLSLEKRTTLIDNSLTILEKYPLFGTGIGNYLLAQSKFPTTYSYFFLQPVHNIFLLFVSEGGLILSAFVGYFLWKLKPWKDAYLLPFLAVVLTGMFDHYWLTLQQNMLLMPVVFALLSTKTDRKM